MKAHFHGSADSNFVADASEDAFQNLDVGVDSVAYFEVAPDFRVGAESLVQNAYSAEAHC